MRQSILYRLSRDHADSLGRVIESWRQDHADALAARDLENLARSCLDLTTTLRKLWSRIQAPDVARAGTRLLSEYAAMLELLEASARRMQSVLELAKPYQEKGYTLEGLEELAAGLNEVLELQARIREDHDWLSTPPPPGTKRYGDTGPLDPARYEDLGELLDRLQAGADHPEG